MTETAAPPKTMTKFTILQLRVLNDLSAVDESVPEENRVVPEVNAWVVIGEIEAPERDRALRLFFADAKEDIDGMYVAVTDAGWNPKPVKIRLSPDIQIG